MPIFFDNIVNVVLEISQIVILARVFLSKRLSFLFSFKAELLPPIKNKINCLWLHTPRLFTDNMRTGKYKYHEFCHFSCVSWKPVCRLHFKRDGTPAETRFHLSAKRTRPFKSSGASVQSTTDRRSLRISSSNVGYTMFRGSAKSTGYPLQSPVSPSLPLPCVTVCHQISARLYLLLLFYCFRVPFAKCCRKELVCMVMTVVL